MRFGYIKHCIMRLKDHIDNNSVFLVTLLKNELEKRIGRDSVTSIQMNKNELFLISN